MEGISLEELQLAARNHGMQLEGLRYDGPTLFIYGGKSDYVRQDHRATIAAYFPRVQYAEVPEAGLALGRWEDWQTARERGCRRSEWRFRKRAYERARAEAMCALLPKYPDYTAVIAGAIDGRGFADALEARVRAAGLADRIRIRGSVQLNSEFDTSIPLATLTPTPNRLRVRNKNFWHGLWMFIGVLLVNREERFQQFVALGLENLTNQFSHRDGDDHLVRSDRRDAVRLDGRRVGERLRARLERPNHEVRKRSRRTL